MLTFVSLGMEVYNLSGKMIACFDAGGDATNPSITSDIEILRGDLARIFVNAAVARPGVQAVYDDHVTSILQPEDGSGPVHVEFANRKVPAGDYDLVVAADGVMSQTRALATGALVETDTYPLDGYNIAYFTAPRTAGDSPTHARYYTALGARSVFIRPSPAGTGILFMFHCDDATPRGTDAQKARVAEVYDGVGWEAPRLLEAMAKSDDFYYQRLTQVKTARWGIGRVALLGDSAYAPTTFTGAGTSLALYGAYVLAGELGAALREGQSVPDALARYDATARPYVERVQKNLLPARAVFPRSRLGVQALNVVVMLVYVLVCWLRVPTHLLQRLTGNTGEVELEPLPDYEWTDERS
jgi:2-polyprenyl-6-methoxyphenol hydroxylase-like FAD-dependent oxidoreductase